MRHLIAALLFVGLIAADQSARADFSTQRHWHGRMDTDPDLVVSAYTALLEGDARGELELIEIYYARGNQLYDMGEYERAIADYNQKIGRAHV